MKEQSSSERKRIDADMEFSEGMILKHEHTGSTLLVGAITRYTGIKMPLIGEAVKGKAMMFFGYFHWRWCTPEDLEALLPTPTEGN